MSEAADDGRMRAPAHLWVVGILSLLWNGFGGYDYLMTNVRDAGYLRNFRPEMMTYIDTLPLWVMVACAVGVWGAVLGSLLLLARSRFAAAAFAASLLGLAASTLYQQAGNLPASMNTGGLVAMNLVIWAGAILFLVYALRMRRAGVLR